MTARSQHCHTTKFMASCDRKLVDDITESSRMVARSGAKQKLELSNSFNSNVRLKRVQLHNTRKPSTNHVSKKLTPTSELEHYFDDDRKEYELLVQLIKKKLIDLQKRHTVNPVIRHCDEATGVFTFYQLIGDELQITCGRKTDIRPKSVATIQM